MARLPRIAVLTSYFPAREEPYRGHGAYQTLRHLTGRAELRAFVPLPTYPEWYRRAPREFRYRRMDLAYRPPELDARYFQYVTLPGVGRLCNGRLALGQVSGAIAAFDPDLILNYWLYPDGWAAVRLGQRLRKPVVVCALGSDLRRVGDFFTRRATRYTVSRADFVLAVSGELRERALTLGASPARTRTILNGYDEKVFYPGNRPEARAQLGLADDAEYIVYVGSLIPSKGLRELSEAFVALAARRPRLHLMCGGEGPYAAELRARAEAAGLAGRLLLPGKLTSPEVRNWLVACDVFCLPSHSEGCPNVIVEALACDRAVVATRVGGIPELVNAANGLLVEPRDAGALTLALEQALEKQWNPGAVAGTYVRGWRAVADETWEVCQGLL